MNLSVESNRLPVCFAPLQGYTDASYRRIHALVFGGVEQYYTPFVRLEKGEFRKRDLRDIQPENNNFESTIPQLIAATPEEFRRIAACFSDLGYRRADINLGCPFPLLTKRHKGAGILPFPDEVAQLLACIGEFPDIRFSVKLRLGLADAGECLALLPVLNALPLEQVVLHPRLGIQQYGGCPDMDAFSQFYEACRLPLCYNGDLLTPEDFRRVAVQYPRLRGVLAGRGLLTRPALALEYVQGSTLPVDDYKCRLRQMHDALYDIYRTQLQGDHQLLSKMKSFWEYPAVPFGRKAAKRIHKASRLSAYQDAVCLLFEGEMAVE